MANQKITVERLAADEKFQQWVLAPTPELEKYWNIWLQNWPEHKDTSLKARQLLLGLQLKGESAPKDLQKEVWDKIKITTESESGSRVFGMYNTRVRVWVAASLTLFLAAAAVFLTYYLNRTSSYQTAYGETKTVILPDGSTIMLNANSSVRFAADWEATELREVWLEGEAFFDVRQIPISTDSSMRLPFVVHSRNMDVEVLGTTFNVKDRESYSEVVLNTGKVNVVPRLEPQTAPIAMNPGDRLAYSSDKQEWKIQHVNPEISTSWRNQKLIFDEMPLADIAQLLEDVYGYEITIENDEIKSYAFTGNIKTKEIEMLIPMLGRSFDLKIEQDGKAISFGRK